jgi:hypothetical protein
VDMFEALLDEVIDRAFRSACGESCDEAANAAQPMALLLRPDREYMRVFLYSLLNKQVRQLVSTGSSPAT